MIEMILENLPSIRKLSLKTDIADGALFKTVNIAVIKAKDKHVNSFITCLPIYKGWFSFAAGVELLESLLPRDKL